MTEEPVTLYLAIQGRSFHPQGFTTLLQLSLLSLHWGKEP